MTTCTHHHMPRVDEVCADDAEVLALSVTRFVAAGYMTGDAACWDAAHRGAEEVLGPADGPPFVARMVSLMRAIRAERQADWRFLPATCCRVTADERRLLALLALARGRDDGRIAAEAAQLAGVPDAPRLRLAARLGAEALDGAQARLSGAPRLVEEPRRPALH